MRVAVSRSGRGRLLAVGRVGEPVQALAAMGVGAVGVDRSSLTAPDRPADPVLGGARGTGAAVERDPRTSGAVRSMKVAAPGLAQRNRTTVTDPN